MTRHTLIASLLIALTACQAAHAERSATTTPSSTGPTAPRRPRILKFKHMRVDLDGREITLDTTVCLRKGPLELLVCKADSKEHESILKTSASAAQLHAALLAMGLTPGKPGEWAGGKEPRFTPPRGAAVKLTLRWKDPKGNIHEADPSAWLALSEKGPKTPMVRAWVFVGSDILDSGRYWADVDGDVISVANFASAVIDVPFESSDKNAILSFKANTAVIPPLKTPVQVVVAPVPGAQKAPHARVTLYLDRMGRMRIGPQAVTLKQLEKWAQKYAADHAKGRVIIRAAPRAVTHDIATIRRELEIGGVSEVRVEHQMSHEQMLPRSADDVAGAMRGWKDKFAKGERLLTDPAEDAAETLARIRAELTRAKRHRDLLRGYAEQLERALKQYRASTQPAGDKKSPASD